MAPTSVSNSQWAKSNTYTPHMKTVFARDMVFFILKILLLFILAFTIFQMVTFYTEIKIISIVWTSVIYHGLETVGLMLFSVYLSKHYRGL